MAISVLATTRLVFVGDSITDADRNADPERLGNGFVRIVRDYLRARDPQTAPNVVNAGVGGNTVLDLADRWQRDVLLQRPDLLSVMIGVNDVWYGLSGRGVSADQYYSTYYRLLAEFRTSNAGAHLVLCEPTAIWEPVASNGAELLKPYVDAVHRLALEFHAAPVVPLHSAFEMAHQMRPDIPWTTDGVHPTSSGHMLIARTWLETTGLLIRPGW